jgi:hypothetical protein
VRGWVISSGSARAAATREAFTVAQRIDRVIAAAGVVSAVAGAAFLARVGGYYLLPLWERPASPLHQAFRPSGDIGHAFGWVGAALMLLGVLLYSGRKRLAGMRGRGPMRTWLNAHIYLCLVGPFLVMLHTAGKLAGLGVYSFWSMVVVAASGIVGRWIYQQFPRTIRGDLMGLEQVRAEQARVAARMEGYGLSTSLLRQIEALSEHTARRARGGGGLRAIPALLIDDLARPWRMAGIRRGLRRERRLTRGDRKALRELIAEQAAIARRMAFLDTFRRVFAYWHVIHLAFFAAMLALLFMHVGSELFFGAGLIGGVS